ncbi:endonuclease/exonuclease/phosphatase family protein [Phycicoccus flavus]|uniref:endonuclease/exonuclease/phosphatase family protein n=1 Tax=Phycicoccus flavus TaxID=2502783 RepID=UPI000FEB6AF7|nr:endonuclease/exonuclease/phosphatase family protein [Phycicoccus flavus]
MDRTTLSLATFNLLNLNLPGLPIYSDTDGWTQEQYDAKVRWTAAVLARLDADVVGLEELWHADALHAVLGAAGLTDTYDVLATPADGTRIVCAALVRRGLLVDGSAEWVQHFPPELVLRSSGEDRQTPEIDVRIDGFSRPVLRFEIAPRDDGPAVLVHVCHLKSKAPAPVYREDWYRADPDTYSRHRTALGSAVSTVRRTAEATALRMMLTDVMKGTRTPVVVLGDLNDGQHSNTLNIVTEQPRYLVGISTGGSDVALYTAQTLQEYRDTRDVYYTHVHEDLRESLDHVLVSEEFYDHGRRRVWLFDGLAIVNDHLDDADHKATGTSDHGVVVVRFRYRPA